jgi:hypothetical protein
LDVPGLEQFESTPNDPAFRPQLVLLFGARQALDEGTLAQVARVFPGSTVMGCSSAGHISGVEVLDDGVVVTAIEFERTRLRFSMAPCGDAADSFSCGRALAADLLEPDLKHVFVLSEGLSINGSALVRGFRDILGDEITVTGGLAGDGGQFKSTCIIFEGKAHPGNVEAIGLYGDSVRVGYSSQGGWEPYGPERCVTKSIANVLYQLDGEPALALYKRCLGPMASDLPGSGLLFPLALKSPDQRDPIVRTILAVSEEDQSITFAGEIPEGARVQLMRASRERLVDGAAQAGIQATYVGTVPEPELAILVSCVGRKLILKSSVEDEVEAVRSVVGEKAVLAGFYSYGEISPFNLLGKCELHNQSMTITTISESPLAA